MNVLLVSTGMDIGVKKILLDKNVCQTVLNVNYMVYVMNVLLVTSGMDFGVK
jgi:hypothetical protein